MTYTPPKDAPPWMLWAAKEIGQREKRGGENPRIIWYHAATSLAAKEDEVPWCSSFVNRALQQVGLRGTNSAAAASWLDWGRSLLGPRLGAITVIRSRSADGDGYTGSASGNHVGFWVDQDADDLVLLGGNQNDSVCLGSFALAHYRVLGMRWPFGPPLPPAVKVPGRAA